MSGQSAIAGKTEQGEDLVYVALNVYWEKQRFELPKLPNAYEWKRFIVYCYWTRQTK